MFVIGIFKPFTEVDRRNNPCAGLVGSLSEGVIVLDLLILAAAIQKHPNYGLGQLLCLCLNKVLTFDARLVVVDLLNESECFHVEKFIELVSIVCEQRNNLR